MANQVNFLKKLLILRQIFNDNLFLII